MIPAPPKERKRKGPVHDIYDIHRYDNEAIALAGGIVAQKMTAQIYFIQITVMYQNVTVPKTKTLFQLKTFRNKNAQFFVNLSC